MKLTASHADTCLPSFWGGHHLPHIQVTVHKGMSLGELKADLKSELVNGCVMGADAPADDNEEWFTAAKEAIDQIEAHESAPNPGNKPDDATLFNDLEEVDEDDDGSESVYAFFVFMEE